MAEESQEDRDNSGMEENPKGSGKRRATLLSRHTIEEKDRTCTQQHNQEEGEELSEAGSFDETGAPGTQQDDEPRFELVSHNRSRDRPYNQEGEALSLADYLVKIGNPQSVEGLIHLMKTQAIFIAPYIHLMKAATATGAETQDCLFARHVNNMFTANPKQGTVATSRGRSGNFIATCLVGLTGLMRIFVTTTMQLTGVTWVDADSPGTRLGGEGGPEGGAGLEHLIPYSPDKHHPLHTIEGLTRKLGLLEAPHWGSTPLVIQLDISPGPHTAPYSDTIVIKMRLDYRRLQTPNRAMPAHLRVDPYVHWEYIQTGGERIQARRQARMFRQSAHLITVRIFKGRPSGWARQGRRTLGWFLWPDCGTAPSGSKGVMDGTS